MEQDRNKLVAMAEDFPENKYDFKPTVVQRSFAESILHVVGEDYRLISAIKGSHMGPAGYQDPSLKDFKTKADVVGLIKQVVADGAALIAEQDDSGLQRKVKSPYADVLCVPGMRGWTPLYTRENTPVNWWSTIALQGWFLLIHGHNNRSDSLGKGKK
jgi:hypothetical protein